jgi:hypothetical protein
MQNAKRSEEEAGNQAPPGDDAEREAFCHGLISIGRMGLNGRPIARRVDAFFSQLARVPLLGSVIRRRLIVIRYVGRRSGKTFETPVAYSRRGDDVRIRVAFPDNKSWWRNFVGDGGTITLVGLDGADRSGHAVATRDSAGRVAIRVQFAG